MRPDPARLAAQRDGARPLGIAVLGCGYWGVNYVRLVQELPEARLEVVCDERPARLEEVARRFRDVRVTADLDEVLASDAVGAVIVCTQARHHHAVTLRCLAAGKHVLVEKPLTTRSADGLELVRAAEERGLVLMVGHTFLYNPAVRTVKRYLRRHEVGRVYYLYARRTSLGPIRGDVNAPWDLASHDVSIFNYLLDAEPEWVSAVGARVLRNSREDVGFISLGYPDGVIGHVHVSWAEPNKVREVVVVGSDRRIVFNDLDALERVRIFNKGVAPAAEPKSYGEHAFTLRDGEIVSPTVEASEPLRNQCSHFVECVTTGRRPLSDGRLGLGVVRVMEAIDRSIERRGSPVPVIQERPLARQARRAVRSAR